MREISRAGIRKLARPAAACIALQSREADCKGRRQYASKGNPKYGSDRDSTDQVAMRKGPCRASGRP